MWKPRKTISYTDPIPVVEPETSPIKLYSPPEVVEVIRCARVLMELKDGPRDMYYETRKPHAWENLREALAAFDA